MKFILKRFLAITVIISFALNLSGCATYQIHPEFKERHKNIKSASVMKPQVEAYILTFQGDKKMLDELMPVMEKTTLEQLEKTLSDKGYIVKKLDLNEEALNNNPDLRTTLFHVNEVFKKQLEDIAKRKKKQFTYTLGAEVNTFANLADCDILIFAKEDGIKKSAGEIAKDVAKGLVFSAAALLVGVIAIPIPKTAITVIHIAVIDGNDGAILWYNNNALNPDCNPENQKQLAKVIGSLIKPFPASVFSKESKKKIEEIDKTKVLKTKEEVVPVPVSPTAP